MGLGCWAIGGPWTMEGNPLGWGNVDDEESIRSLQQALDLGITFFDTAPNYGAGHSEYLIGKAFKDKRTKVIIATKFGTIIKEDAKEVEHFLDHKSLLNKIQEDCEDSLRRLQTDYIDLYQFHLGTYSLGDAEEIREVLERLVVDGKIRYYGWSTDDLDCAEVFAKGNKCIAIQHRLNVLKDAPAMLEFTRENKLGSIARGPLGRGLLTGKYDKTSVFPDNDNRAREKFQKQWIGPILGKLDDLRDVLSSGGRTLAQGALGWIWAKADNTIPIPGFKSMKQVEENANAMGFGPLHRAEMDQINQVLS